MKTRLLVGLLFAALAIEMSTGASHAGPVSAALSQTSFTSALVEVQYDCGWRSRCSDRYWSPQGPYYNSWGRPPYDSGSWRGGGRGGYWQGGGGSWQGGGISCDGRPCDEKCGLQCWYGRIRDGYCGHGCNWYRERVNFYGDGDRFTPYVSSGSGGYASHEYSGEYNGAQDAGYSRYPQGGSNGYDSSASAQGDQARNGSPPAPRERIIDRIRRYFSITPRDERRVSSTVRFERPLNGEAVPLKRFNGPKYPPDCAGKKC